MIATRLQVIKSKNAASFYVVKSTYENGKHSSKVVEKLGTYEELKSKLVNIEPVEWAQKYVRELTKQEKERKREIIARFSPVQTIEKDEQRLFNGGYLFLKKIYRELRLDKISMEISEKYKYAFDLDNVLSRLVYARIIFPASKLSTLKLSERFIEPPKFEVQHIYRALEFLAKEMDFIQSELYNNSLKMSERKTGVLYYDCTNYFFEIEQESGMKQYGCSKEHRPNPIVQMGLFMDGDGIPLAFSMTDGSTNEQLTLKPLEEKLLSDFSLSKFVVCTDAGLSSTANRKFNSKDERAFITTQSLKKMKQYLKKWALDNTGWKLSGSGKTYDIIKLDDKDSKERDKYTGLTDDDVKAKTFYKTRWINEDGLEQHLIVTYSIRYRDYQRKIRNRQIERARKLIETNPSKLKKANQNDYKRLIARKNVTTGGELAEKEVLRINDALIAEEEVFDGLYGVCTNLEDDVSSIIKVNHRRWQIEECFRIMKSEFKARPVYLGRDDRIRAHFLTCFIALIIFRLLEKKLDDRFTCYEIIDGLRQMNFFKLQGEGYIPTYTRNDFTDALHEVFGFRTDYQIVTLSNMKKIFSKHGVLQNITHFHIN